MATLRLHRRHLLAGLSLSAVAAPAAAEQAPSAKYEVAEGPLTLKVVDLSPRFLDFWAAAKDEADADKRFALWKDRYGFAAAPPGPRFDGVARSLLDGAWDRYPGAIGLIRAGARGMQPDPMSVLKGVARVLQPPRPLTVQVTAYVGGFEENAFTYRGQYPTVAVPLEMDPVARRTVFAHEMTHAVHLETARLEGGWERTIGLSVIQEGLAMHVAREVFPGLPLRSYVGGTPGWWSKAEAGREAVLRGVLPALEAKDGETVFKYTMGEGTTGLNREVYIAGWFVVGELRRRGMSLAQIARVSEPETPALARGAILTLLGEKG
jgi:hypothetical protein